MKLAGRLLEICWFCALGLALLAAALTTQRRTSQVEENPSFCDPFGYLQMAQELRYATAAKRAPDFSIETTHTRLLIQLMQAQQVPLPLWDEMVAPLAHHYFPAADHVAVQYPPGAGLVLALFPEGRALHALNRLVIVVFLITGLILVGIAAVRRLPIAGGLIVLAVTLGLEILARLDNASFSINALLAPLWLSGLCLAAAWAVQGRWPNAFWSLWFLILLAGLCFGLAVLARLPVILILPGVCVMLWPASLRRLSKSAWVPFGLGVFITSVVPLMVHQSRVSGVWYLPTYGHENTETHRLKYVRDNLIYYLTDKPSADHWALPLVFLGCCGLFFWSAHQTAPKTRMTLLRQLTWRRLSVAALLMLIISSAYFLTHFVAINYYLVPATFGSVLLLALGAFAMEQPAWQTSPIRGARRIFIVLAFMVALSPGFDVMARAWSRFEPPAPERAPKQFAVPAELADESAWVWACELSGTLWYYARKPAHKLTSTNAETRLLVYKFVKDRGEPQYIVTDDDSMQRVADEIVQLGGTLERRGQLDGFPYFLIHWPSNRP